MSRLLVVDLNARSRNWALTPAGEQAILAATPSGWDVHIVRALTSSDGDGPPQSSDESIAAIRDAEVYFGFGLPKDLFEAARRLRWVHSAAAGVVSSLHPGMRASDILLSNSAGIHSIPIAEYVVAGVLHFFRGLDVAAHQQRESRWDKAFFVSADSPVREVGGARILVVGAGGIGGQVAIRFRALGATCVGVRRNPDRGTPDGFERVVGPDALDAELPDADVVVLTAPLTAESKGFMTAERLKRLKKGSILVNVARGALVDEEAMANELRDGHLRGAVLDVFQKEPLAGDSPLWQLRNVLLTPHISPVSPGRFWPRALEVFCDNWRRYVRGEPLRNLVDKQAGY